MGHRNCSFVQSDFGFDNLDPSWEYLQPNWDKSVDRFDDMGLKEEVLRGIYGYGFNKPSPIQMKGILPVIQGNDTIAQVSTLIELYYFGHFRTIFKFNKINTNTLFYNKGPIRYR